MGSPELEVRKELGFHLRARGGKSLLSVTFLAMLPLYFLGPSRLLGLGLRDLDRKAGLSDDGISSSRPLYASKSRIRSGHYNHLIDRLGGKME